MRSRYLFAVLVGVSLAAACGGSPSSPSSSSTNSNLAAQTVVMSAMAQAMSQITVVSPTGDNTFTMPCPGGGTIVTTFTMTPPSQGNIYRSTSRTEFRDCKNQTVTVNGDPYLETTAEHSFSSTGGPVGDSTSTLTMTGGMRMDGNGVRGRAQFNCTTIASVHVVNGAPQFSFTSSGTITFEQPIGSTPVTRPCGPS